MFGRKRTIRITDISCRIGGGTSRVSASVNGSELWFESRNAELRPSAEAFASAMLLPALLTRADIEVEAPLSPGWVANARRVLEIFGRWLELPAINILSPLGGSDIEPRGTKTAVCFSGGVDSFFTLLRGPFRNVVAVLIHGFDIDLEDEGSAEVAEQALLEVADAVGAGSTVIKTNIRKHPVFKMAPWGFSHGGALAATGHVMGDVKRFVISSTFHKGHISPWGSHWETDPLFSSEELEIVHWDPSFRRVDKLRAIVDEPLVKKHLRVCWGKMNELPNCSRCEKCVRTMLTIEALGSLDQYVVFDLNRSLAEVVDEMPYIDNKAIYYFSEILTINPDFGLSGQIRALIERSRRHYKNKKGFPRLLAKVDQKLIRHFRAG